MCVCVSVLYVLCTLSCMKFVCVLVESLAYASSMLVACVVDVVCMNVVCGLYVLCVVYVMCMCCVGGVYMWCGVVRVVHACCLLLVLSVYVVHRVGIHAACAMYDCARRVYIVCMWLYEC